LFLPRKQRTGKETLTFRKDGVQGVKRNEGGQKRTHWKGHTVLKTKGFGQDSQTSRPFVEKKKRKGSWVRVNSEIGLEGAGEHTTK